MIAILAASRNEAAENAFATTQYRTTPRWADEVLNLTGGKSVDLLLDVAGGTGINQSVSATKARGRNDKARIWRLFSCLLQQIRINNIARISFISHALGLARKQPGAG